MTILKCRGGDGLYFTRDRFSYFSARADARTHTHAHIIIRSCGQFIVVMDIIITQSRPPLKVEKTRRYSIIILLCGGEPYRSRETSLYGQTLIRQNGVCARDSILNDTRLR